jgi:acylphosphatase
MAPLSEGGGHSGRRRPSGRLGAVEVLVGGRVQGVGYRNFAKRRAHDRRLTGYAVNLPDGRVKIRAEGDLEAIEQFVLDLGAGPPLARVERVDVNPVPFSGRYREFGIRFSEG